MIFVRLRAAGAAYVARTSTYDKGLVEGLEAAMAFDGFSLVDIWGICPGRYTRGNKITPKKEKIQRDRQAPGFR